MKPIDFDYDSIPVGYYDEIFQRRQGMQSKWHHLKFNRVREEFPARGVHVDVACGPGTFMGTLPPATHSVGVDISEPQINYARQHYTSSNRSFKTMQPGLLDFPDASTDIATSIELIEHISKDEAVRLLRECHRILKPGGKMVITTPNYAFLWPVIELVLNKLGKVSYDEQHITKYTPDKLRQLLADAGFTTVKVETCLWSAPFAAALGWNFSDLIARLEPGFVTKNLGHLLIGVATKQ
jgi:2-polyprenyl-3-methyl-5-hydroxy-6-metoxy-1,4-benzoquinol methylase